MSKAMQIAAAANIANVNSNAGVNLRRSGSAFRGLNLSVATAAPAAMSAPTQAMR